MLVYSTKVGGRQPSTYLFFLRVQLPVDVYSTAQVLLRPLTELFVLIQDLPVEGIDVGELLICGVLMAVYLVLYDAPRRRYGDHALEVEEVVTASIEDHHQL